MYSAAPKENRSYEKKWLLVILRKHHLPDIKQEMLIRWFIYWVGYLGVIFHDRFEIFFFNTYAEIVIYANTKAFVSFFEDYIMSERIKVLTKLPLKTSLDQPHITYV